MTKTRQRLSATLIALVLLLLPAGCATMRCAPECPCSRDAVHKLAGTWSGEYMDHETGVLRFWVQDRSVDGTYTILFVHLVEGRIRKSADKGTWWVENGKYYEKARNVDDPDEYEFEFIDDVRVHFRSTSSDYEFMDTEIDYQQGVPDA